LATSSSHVNLLVDDLSAVDGDRRFVGDQSGAVRRPASAGRHVIASGQRRSGDLSGYPIRSWGAWLPRVLNDGEGEFDVVAVLKHGLAGLLPRRRWARPHLTLVIRLMSLDRALLLPAQHVEQLHQQYVGLLLFVDQGVKASGRLALALPRLLAHLRPSLEFHGGHSTTARISCRRGAVARAVCVTVAAGQPTG
jgi:hypothetical protein